jgi:tRNA modification GTPase
MDHWSTEDTIAAIATAPGPAGLSVVRVSGPAALTVADRVFRGVAPLLSVPSHTLHHGWAAWPDDGGRRLDEVVAAVFRAPRSYTREDVVEFSCHGGELPARAVLEALMVAGARLARGGEFTLRAFLHGRLDLAQAEAVADLVQAETEAAREQALGQLGGALSRELRILGERLADCIAEVEARVDFAEDVGGVEVPPHVLEGIGALDAALARLLEGAAYARAVREGLRLPIVGRPNVGKSALFNALVGEERAIVTPIPGTTRDRVSERVEIAGVRIALSDTAGLRAGAGEVERLGVQRTRDALAGSPLALWVVDGSAPLDEADREAARELGGKRVVAALNKSDLGAALEPSAVVAALADAAPACARCVRVSARTGAGLDTLRVTITEVLGMRRGSDLAAHAPGNARHAEALARSRDALARAAAAGREGAPGEIVALELHEAAGALGEVTGQSVSEDLLERIFSRFCVGK